MNFNRWIIELEEELSLLDSENLLSQAQENMNVFGITREVLDSVSIKDIEHFVTRCHAIYSAKNSGDGKVFYCWLDEMAGQIRMSAVSKKFAKLPFKVSIQSCTSHKLASTIKTLDSGTFTNGKLIIWQNGI